MDLFKKIWDLFVSLFVRAGLTTFKFLAAVLLAIISSICFIFSEIWEIIKACGRGIRWLWHELTESFRDRVKLSNELHKEMRRAKKESKKAHRNAVLYFIGSFFFGEGGVAYTAFNYLLPVVSVVFLVGVIAYGSKLEYGIAVEYNGRELGIISAEADYDAAERDVQQRISYTDNEEIIDMSPKFSLRIISDDDKYLTSGQLADLMLAASDQELAEAYGIYIDGSFAGAVRDCAPVQDALDTRLLNYETDGIVKEISYANKVEFTKGIYLLSSIRDEQETIAQLTASKESRKVYVAQQGDTVVGIIQKYGMTLDKFKELNPAAEMSIRQGQMLNVIETENFLPVKCIREMESLTFLDYETVEVETSALNVGIRSVLVKGERGEKKSEVEVTYIDGIESSRKILSSIITKNPVVETIGIGTYSARPDDPQTVYFGTPLVGSGTMGWPVNGGWVSDSFISDRNHKGLDIAAPEGTEIYAASDGYVVSAGWNSGGYGNVVMIEHMDGYATVYAHMIAVAAGEGQYVTKGQLIGFVGNTGNSFGDHCHFEVRYKGICLDPAAFLRTIDMKQEGEE